MNHASRSRTLSAVFCICLVIVCLSLAGTGTVAAQQVDVAASELAGNGTADDPYIITTASELQAMEDDLDAHYQLGADIDASGTAQWNNGAGFVPVGPDDDTGFTGSFDGDDHTITGLTIDRSGSLWVGLFGYVDSAEIRDVTLADTTITGGEYVGELAGEVGDNSTIRGVTVNGTVDGNENVGGLVGASGLVGDDSTITDVTASSTVNGSTAVGGLVGYHSVHGSVQTAAATDITVTGETTTGGLIGYNSGLIEGVTASGTVDGANETGGLVGSNEALNGEIINATATTSVTGANHVGGLVGGNGDRDGDELARIRNASAHGTVDGQNDVGGFVGTNVATIREATATGAVTGEQRIGGFAGRNGNIWNSESSIRVTKSTGNVTGESVVGGHVGMNRRTVQYSFAAGEVTATDTSGGFVVTSMVSPLASEDIVATANKSYWDTEATGQSTSAGDVTGLTTAEMTGEGALANMTDLQDFYWQPQPDGYPVLEVRASDDSSEAALNVSLSEPTITAGTETSVTVTVTDSGTGDPIEGATVEISDLQQSATTDANGTVSLSVNTSIAGVYPIDVTANGYEDVSTTLTVTPEDAAPVVVGDTPAQDPDRDGTFEDVNGDGAFDIVDINAIFQNRNSDVVQNNSATFDFNGDGEFNIVDVNALFQNS